MPRLESIYENFPIGLPTCPDALVALPRFLYVIRKHAPPALNVPEVRKPVMRSIRQAFPLLFLALFWFAQVQGTVHGFSHLRTAVDASSHTLSSPTVPCAECDALAQASAAPQLAPPSTLAAAAPVAVLSTIAIASIAASPLAAYRSRAPPAFPI